MNPLDRQRQLELVREANRAPSVHNVQPGRWRFLPDGHVLLFEDLGRHLSVADPEGRDGRVSLGAEFEGLRIALSRQGLGLRDPDYAPPAAPETSPLRLVARSAVVAGDRTDPLAAFVLLRHTYRGRFAPVDDATVETVRVLFEGCPDVIVISRPSEIAEIAEVHDRCTYQFVERAEYHAELYRWMRFSRRDPAWDRDGLTADCLGMSGFERALASGLFHPRAFRILRTLRLARPLVAEAPQTRSAHAIAIFHRHRDEDAFAIGRRFYRLWLEVCRAGFSLCPMSAVADSPEGSAWVRQRWGVPEHAAIVNVLRIGLAPEGALRASPRLPAEELLV